MIFEILIKSSVRKIYAKSDRMSHTNQLSSSIGSEQAKISSSSHRRLGP